MYGKVAVLEEKLSKVVSPLQKWGSDIYGKLPKKIQALNKEIEQLNKDNTIGSSRERIRKLEMRRTGFKC